MKTVMLGALLLLLACRKDAPPPEPVPGPDVVAIVLGHWITRSELGKQPLENLVNPPLFRRFVQENQIAPTELELRGFAQYLRAIGGKKAGEAHLPYESRDEEEWIQKRAKELVIGWKIDRLMYEMYGGDVTFEQSNPLTPVGAYRKFLEGEEKAGRLKILDPVLAKSYWAYYRLEHRFVYDPSEVDYSLPFWAQKKK